MGSQFPSICRSVECHWPTRECDLCSGRESCSWYGVFGQKLTNEPIALKRHQKPPLPFVFSFPFVSEITKKDCEIKCGLVVIGQAIQHLEMLLKAFAELLTNDDCPVRAEVIRVGSRDYQGDEHLLGYGNGLMRPVDLVVLSAEGLLENSFWDCSALRIRMLSPLRLLENGRPIVRFDFSRFARSVMRRVSSLAYYYGDYEFDCDFRMLSHLAKAVSITEDKFILTTSGNRKMSGITGYGSFAGDFSGLMPFLVLGTYVHVGKAASYGMGRYELFIS